MILDIMQLLITLMFTLVGSADSGVGFPPFYYGCRVVINFTKGKLNSLPSL
jgi:hypothetical protein